MPFSSAVHTEPGHIFSLWLSQWRLSILDCESARPVLASVLDSMLTESGQYTFWQHLEQFFSSEENRSEIDSAAFDSLNPDSLNLDLLNHDSPNPDSPNEDVSAALGHLENPDLSRQLAERARQLPPRGAKCLLEHLSRRYSLEGENVVFWRIVAKAIQPGESQQGQPAVRVI
jgi:hypothetical protein